jgi:predicted nucleotidyltransferase
VRHLPHLTEEERAAVEELKREVVRLVGARLKGFYLFGSKARGDDDPESDLDVAILIDQLDRHTKSKILDIVTDIELRNLVVISSLVLSWEDFADLRRRERRIAFDIEREGIAL